MIEITRIAIDTSKSVFTLHGVDASGRAMLRRNLRRGEWADFFAQLPPAEVVPYGLLPEKPQRCLHHGRRSRA